MATIIDALVVPLARNARGFTQEAEEAWKSLLRMVDEAGRAVRSVEANGRETPKFFGKVRRDALALLDLVTAGFGLEGLAGNTLADPYRKDSAGAADAAQENGVSDGMPDRPMTDKAAPSAGGWQNALLALGSFKILAATNSLPGLASALGAVVTSLGAIGGDSDTTGLAALGAAGRAAGDIALRIHAKDMKSIESKRDKQEEAGGLAGNVQAQGNFDARSPGDDGNASRIEAWSPSRQASFKRAFGIDVDQSTHEQQLAFVDWESHNIRPPASEKTAGAKAPRRAGDVMNRYLGLVQSDDATGEARKDVAAAGAIYDVATRDDLERGSAAAVSTAMAAQRSADDAPSIATTSNTSETHIHGAITVVAQATDGPGVARELAAMGRTQSLVQQGNTGIF